MCAACGAWAKPKGRTRKCPDCNQELHRDLNAAINIWLGGLGRVERDLRNVGQVGAADAVRARRATALRGLQERTAGASETPAAPTSTPFDLVQHCTRHIGDVPFRRSARAQRLQQEGACAPAASAAEAAPLELGRLDELWPRESEQEQVEPWVEDEEEEEDEEKEEEEEEEEDREEGTRTRK